MNCRRNSYGGYSPPKLAPNDPGSLVTMLSHAPDDPACKGSCSESSYDTLKASHCVSEHIEQSSKEKKTHIFFEGTGGAEPLLRFIEKKLGCERQPKNKQTGIQGVTPILYWQIAE